MTTENEDRLDSSWKDKFGAPNIIYLQLHGDDDPDLADDQFVDCTEDVSWCWEMINEFDVEYIRMDLHQAEVEKLRGRVDRLKEREREARKIEKTINQNRIAEEGK